MRHIAFLVVIAISLVQTVPAFAAGSSGIEVGLDNAYMLGKGNAGVADPQDSSTIVYNPAGLTHTKNEILMGTTILFPIGEYESVAMTSEDAATLPAYIPAFFATAVLGFLSSSIK